MVFKKNESYPDGILAASHTLRQSVKQLLGKMANPSHGSLETTSSDPSLGLEVYCLGLGLEGYCLGLGRKT